jgi:outer membrane protein assembly factor BamB
VINLRKGDVARSRPEVAYTSDEAAAHNGRLFVAESSSNRLLAYDLKTLDTSEPAILYTSGKDADVKDLTPCGDDRICFVETVGYDRAKAQVVAFDLEKHREAWRRPAPEVASLVPVGDAVLAVADDSTTLFDADGKPQWTDQPGVAARLDAANVLRFSGTLSASVADQTLDGVHLGDQPVQMGVLRAVRGGTCSWNTFVLACVADKDFVVTRFAG